MRHVIMAALLAIIVALPATAQKKPPMKTAADSASYAVGIDLGRRVRADSLPLTADLIMAGLRDGMAGKSVMSDEQIAAAIGGLQRQIQAREQAKFAVIAERNRSAGEAFLAENGKRSTVMTLPSGVQYEVITPGTGAKPAAADRVKVHYTGMLIDGKIFDSSVQRGEPVVFGLGEVIRGWTEGLQEMQEGGKYKLYIPSDLAYGPQGRGEVIPPSATLVFEVELIKVNP